MTINSACKYCALPMPNGDLCDVCRVVNEPEGHAIRVTFIPKPVDPKGYTGRLERKPNDSHSIYRRKR
jgi:hypothetical protein